jgi:hypothetical protein
MKLKINEVLQKVSNAKTKAEKIKLLQTHNSPALRAILIANFNESIVSDMPEGPVPYADDKYEEADRTNLQVEYKKLYVFFKGGAPAMSRMKKESMFIQMLESLSPGEAEVITLVMDKQLGKRWKITQQCVAEAFPQILWNKRA